MPKKAKKKKRFKVTKGSLFTFLGFILIVVNALNYLLGWNKEFTILWILGLAFLVIGINLQSKSKRRSTKPF